MHIVYCWSKLTFDFREEGAFKSIYFLIYELNTRENWFLFSKGRICDIYAQLL